jgi:hypothetical protein
MPTLFAGIHEFHCGKEIVGGRDKPGRDGGERDDSATLCIFPGKSQAIHRHI